MRVLRQKITVPSWDGRHPRPRLDARYAGARHLLVVAPAGFGKTTWMSLAFPGTLRAWLTLEPEEADLDRFMGHVIASLEAAIPGFRTDARTMLDRAREPDGARAVLETLLADLDEQVEAPVTWVLDGYHQVATPSLDDLVSRLWKYLPKLIRLVILTRQEPALPFRSRLATGELTLVTEAELALDEEEARIWDPGLTHEMGLQRLRETGGMPAAWSWSAVALESHLEEALGHLGSPAVRDLLVRLSWLDGLPIGSVEEALGVAAADEALAEGIRARLVQRDPEGMLEVLEPYRQALRSRSLLDGHDPGIRAARDRLARYLWTHGQQSTAIEQWLAGGQDATALSRFEEVVEAWLREGHLERVERLLLRLGHLPRTPLLVLAHGELLRRRGQFEPARQALAHADQACTAAGLPVAAARARIRLGMLEAASGELDRARALLDRARAWLASDPVLEMDLRNLEGGLRLLEGQPRAAIGELEASLDLARRLDDPASAARALHNLGVARTQLGLFRAALETYDRALATYQDAGMPRVWMTPVNRALVLMHLERHEEGLRAAEEALALVRRFHLRREQGFALRTMAHGHLATGRPLQARMALDEAERLAREAGDALALGYAHHYRIALALVESDLPRARLALEDLTRLLGEDALQTPEFMLTRIRMARATGDDAQARHLFEALKGRAEAQGATGLLAWIETHLTEPDQPGLPPVPDESGPSVELVIRCLGGFHVTRRGQDLHDRDWQSARARHLFAYLLHTPEGSIKDQLLEALYPDEPGSDAPLNMSLTRMRKALEPDLERGQASRYVLRADGRYRFDRQIPFDLDTLRFEEAIRRMRSRKGNEALEAARAALEAYGGEFLPGVDLAWVLALRQRYRDLALEACQVLLDGAPGEVEAWTWIARALEIDPLDETFNREVVLRHLEAEDRHRAREHLELYGRRYRDRLGIDPPSDLTELVTGP